jgi:hypothetical protein
MIICLSIKFILFDSAAVIKQSPFEVSESGWGEFESSIRIYFKDVDESPVDIPHLIKLYYPPPALPNLKKVRLHEFLLKDLSNRYIVLFVACDIGEI